MLNLAMKLNVLLNSVIYKLVDMPEESTEQIETQLEIEYDQ